MKRKIKTTTVIFLITVLLILSVILIICGIMWRHKFPVYKTNNFAGVDMHGDICTTCGDGIYYVDGGVIKYTTGKGDEEILVDESGDIHYLRTNGRKLVFAENSRICIVDLLTKEQKSLDMGFSVLGLALDENTIFAETVGGEKSSTGLYKIDVDDLSAMEMTGLLFSDAEKTTGFMIKSDESGYRYLYANSIVVDDITREIVKILAIKDVNDNIVFSGNNEDYNRTNVIEWSGNLTYIMYDNSQIFVCNTDDDVCKSVDIPKEYSISSLNSFSDGGKIFLLAQDGTSLPMCRYNFPLNQRTSDAVLSIDIKSGSVKELFSLESKDGVIVSYSDGQAICFNRKGELKNIDTDDKNMATIIRKIKKGKEMTFERCENYMVVSADGRTFVFLML